MPARTPETPGKPAAKKVAGETPAAKPRAAARPYNAPRKNGRVAAEDRQRFIAEAAYFKAEKRGFAEGAELDDWIEAEAEIDALLGTRGSA